MLHELVCLPRGGTDQPLLWGDGGRPSAPLPSGTARCRSCISSERRQEGLGAVSHDKRVIDTLVCSAADLKQCPLFIPGEAWPYRVSSS